MAQIATHDGKVVAVETGKVKVEMHVVSACSSCKAHEKCAFVDNAEKIVEVETSNWNRYTVGDRVVVSVNEGLGLLAVLLAYLLPAVVIIATLVLSLALIGNEGLAALITLAITALYFLLLYRMRNRLQQKFSFGISPLETV